MSQMAGGMPDTRQTTAPVSWPDQGVPVDAARPDVGTAAPGSPPGMPLPGQVPPTGGVASRMAARDTGYARQPRLSRFYRFWKPPITILVATGLFLAMWYALLAILMGAGIADRGFVTGLAGGTLTEAETFLTARGALLVVGGLGLMLPALALAAHVTRERPIGTVSSVEGRLRPAPLLASMAVSMAIAAAALGLEWLLAGRPQTIPVPVPPEVLLILVVALPLQCLAEEYLFRGHLMQTLASWLPRALMPLAVVFQAVPFMLLHPYDAYGLAGVLVMGISLGWVATRTGGLEASGGIHIANNVVAFAQVGLGLSGSLGLGGAGIAIDIILPIAMAVASVLVVERIMGPMVAARRELGHQPGILFPSQADALMWERIQERQMAEWRELGEQQPPVGGTPADVVPTMPEPVAPPEAFRPSPAPEAPSRPEPEPMPHPRPRPASAPEPPARPMPAPMPEQKPGAEFTGAISTPAGEPVRIHEEANIPDSPPTTGPGETSPALMGIMMDLLGDREPSSQPGGKPGSRPHDAAATTDDFDEPEDNR